MKNIAIVLGSLFLVFGLLAEPIRADNCTTQYGGESCTPEDLIINKEVRNPLTNKFVENLTSTDATFTAGSEVHFQLTIKNTSGETFNPVRVRDVFPEFLSFVSGPGVYTPEGRHLDFELANLTAGESRTIEIVAKVEAKAANSAPFCLTNYAVASAPSRPNGDDDTSQLCVSGVPTLPVAGWEDWIVFLPFLALGTVGLFLARTAK